MVNFGYAPLEIKILDLDKANLALGEWIAQHDETFGLCIACGSCTATCTAGKFTEFSFREMCHSVRRGEYLEAIAESEKCMLCGKCTLACPRNVNTRHIVKLVRKAHQNFSV